MRAGRPTPARAPEDTRDDLERISGIGPAIARRLEGAGIATYGELADSTPAAVSALLGGIGGTSAGRIAESDWIGQARRLAPSRAPKQDAQRSASFSVEFLLEGNDEVLRTTVQDRQSGARDAWDGWDGDRLLTALQSTRTAAQVLPSAPSATKPAAPAEPASSGSAVLRVSRLASAHPRSRRGAVRSDEPTFVGIEMVAPAAPAPMALLDYIAEVAARRLDGSGEIPIVRLHGAVRAGQSISHAGSGQPLPPGLYRLVAVVRTVGAGQASTDESARSPAVSGEIVAVTDASRPDGKRAANAEAAAHLRAGEELLAGGVITEMEFAGMQATWHQEGP